MLEKNKDHRVDITSAGRKKRAVITVKLFYYIQEYHIQQQIVQNTELDSFHFEGKQNNKVFFSTVVSFIVLFLDKELDGMELLYSSNSLTEGILCQT